MAEITAIPAEVIGALRQEHSRNPFEIRGDRQQEEQLADVIRVRDLLAELGYSALRPVRGFVSVRRTVEYSPHMWLEADGRVVDPWMPLLDDVFVNEVLHPYILGDVDFPDLKLAARTAGMDSRIILATPPREIDYRPESILAG